MTPKLRKQLLAHINNVTRDWEKRTRPKGRTNEKAQRLFELIKGNFGCYEDRVLALIATVSDVSFDNLIRTAGNDEYPVYLAVVHNGADGVFGERDETLLISTNSEGSWFYGSPDEQWELDGDFINARLKAASPAQINKLTDYQLDSIYHSNPVAFVEVPRATRARRKK